MRRIAYLLLVFLLISVATGYLWARRPSGEVESTAAWRASIESSVTAFGTLQPRRYVDVGAQVSGQILRLNVQPGDIIEKGQLLVEIDPSVQRATVDAGRASLAGLRAQLADQRAQHRLASQQHARQRQMAADGATREEDVQNAEAALASAAARIDNLEAQIAQTQATLKADEARLGYTRIYAPMAGTVVSVAAREGQTLNATYQTPDVLRIADLSSMTVWSEVSEADVGRVKAGMPVYFTTLGNSRRRWHGKVRQVLPAPPPAGVKTGASDSSTAAPAAPSKVVVYTALFDIDNADGELMPQMTAQVTFVESSAAEAVVVPAAALLPVPGADADRFMVRVLRTDGSVETRPLRVGVRNRVIAQALDGIQVGDRIVTGLADGKTAKP
ncbi:macrolide-specific efflux system membrane fusion protein [Variovorax boronicumulans]|uniref:efflux RND transporter periplasmic adaptor subunit n=1 Tax=Variovorax boronicumulans TaxID=436515 RepID=UPI0027889B5C|nr:efflux RND transporter periplasmic adaptor subunit [Variovorax boronicumulans]MDQ0073681.1 macrolide-specific efflux system membrane fusion protein [Variovorax boronicumulans]